MLVLVTGATGFLGAHIVERLCADGHEVRALVRPTSDTSHLESLGVERTVADLAAGAGLDEALRDVEAVVHAAGGGSVRRASDYRANNTDTTARLLDALARRGELLRRFVLLSSVAAHGPSADGAPRDPDAEPAPVSAYGRSKRDAEALVLAAEGLPTTILRPPAIYGPGDTRLLPLFRAVARGRYPVVGRGRSTSLVYGPDCAAAVSLALTTPHPTGRAYFVAEDTPYTWETIGQRVAEALGVSARPLRLPVAAVHVAGAASELWARLRLRPAALNRDKVRDMTQPHWVCDPAPIRRELGWRPTLHFPEGAAHTARWYTEQGWL